MRLNVPKDNRLPRKMLDLSRRPAMRVRLLENVGLLPSGDFVFELPSFVATRLIAKKQAVAVGIFGTAPDLVLTEDECIEAGL